MASDVLTLFNMPSSQDIAQGYLNSQMVSPAQMGNQGLLQQVASLGSNAGTLVGYGAGRMFGGMAPQEARARGIEDAMRTVQGMGLTSDAEMYSALSKELAARGLTQDAFAANKEARAAMRDELAVKKGGMDIELAGLQIKKAKEDLLTLEEQLAQAMSFGDEPRAAGIQRQIDARKKEIEKADAYIKHQKDTGEAALKQADAAIARANKDTAREKFTIPVYAPGIVPGTRGDIIGRQNAIGQVQGNDGLIYNSVNELLASRTPASQQTPPKPEDNKPQQPKVPIAERINQLQGNTGSGEGGAAISLNDLDRQEYSKAQQAYQKGFEVVGRGNSIFGKGELLFQNKQTGEKRWASQL